MIGRTNAGGMGGGAAGAIKAGTIVVSYPTGGECTVTNGVKTYDALDTSGAAAFAVEAGTWTVSVLIGGKTLTESVTVPAQGWKDVYISLAVVLFDGSAGGDNTAVTGGWSVNNANLAVISTEKLSAKLSNNGTTESRGEFTTVNSIDLTGKTKVCVTLDTESGDYGFVSILNGTAEVATQTRLVAGSHSLDIPSGVSTGKIRVGVGQRMLGANTQFSNFTKVWLE